MDTNEMVAYSPLLSMRDSHVGIYKIYTLKNPFTQEIFYVGQTMQEIETRLVGHLADKEVNKEKIEYIKDILSKGEKPIIEAIETIAATCYIDKMAVNEREIYWIRYYKSLGCNLLNKAATAPDTKCKEYHTYLSAIKKGKSSYHYYYCGTTFGGVRVYDEKRLIADGFQFPDEPKQIYRSGTKECYYNSDNYNRFKLKNGIVDEDKNWKPPVTTEVFPFQPSWSREFLESIPFETILDELDEDDTCDYEDSEIENDICDFELSVGYEGENSEQPARDYTKDEMGDELLSEITQIIINKNNNLVQSKL